MSGGGAVVVGIGQPAAGDDGVGVEVARALRAEGLTVRESADASVLLDLLGGGARVVIVDAVVGAGPAGTVLRLRPDALAEGATPLSSHGIGVAEALALARTLYGDAVTRDVELVGVAVDRPCARTLGLSPEVAAAVGPAAAVVRAIVRSRDA